MTRNITLDLVRTLAIFLMVIFHFIYDLKFFGYIDWKTPDGEGWREFRWLIITLFFLCLGISLSFAHKTQFHAKKFFKRTAQIGMCALVISLATYFAIPNNWIFFGVLHFLALSSLLVIAFVRLPTLSFIIGLSILIFGSLQILPSRWPIYLFFDNLPGYTNDYVAIQPWLGMVFIGVSIGHWSVFINDPLKPWFVKLNTKWQKTLTWPGQHSLSIYLLHQPILLGLLYVIT